VLDLLPLRQLALDTLVAAVETLLTLPLLYLVNADVLVAALEVDIELRQLLDAVEADMTDTWLADAGDIPRVAAPHIPSPGSTMRRLPPVP